MPAQPNERTAETQAPAANVRAKAASPAVVRGAVGRAFRNRARRGQDVAGVLGSNARRGRPPPRLRRGRPGRRPGQLLAGQAAGRGAPFHVGGPNLGRGTDFPDPAVGRAGGSQGILEKSQDTAPATAAPAPPAAAPAEKGRSRTRPTTSTAGRSQATKNGSGVEYHQRETPITMPKTKSDETDSRPAAAVASAGTTPGDLAHEIDLLGAALRLTPEQRAAARLPDCRPPLSPQGPSTTADASTSARAVHPLQAEPESLPIITFNAYSWRPWPTASSRSSSPAGAGTGPAARRP